ARNQEFQSVDPDRKDKGALQEAPRRELGCKITAGIAGGRYRDRLAHAENAVEAKKGDALQGAERQRHGVIGITAEYDGTIRTCHDKNGAANFFSCSKCRAKLRAGRVRRQQQATLELALGQVTLVEQGLERGANAISYRRGQGADVDSFYEAVDNLNLDACSFIQFLRRHDDAGQKIPCADICRLQLSGELEDLGDGYSLADQRRGEFAPGGHKLVKLAFDIEPDEHEAE